MELYDNTLHSFNEFIDSALSKGRAEDGLLKNTFKYAFDTENEEHFINLYFEDHEKIVTPDSARLQYEKLALYGLTC